MPRKPKPGAACWTCRLRRKKCDRSFPECRACRSLNIPCHRSTEKPEWMDSGPSQSSMSEHIKTLIKGGATDRRSKGKPSLRIISHNNGIQQADHDQAISSTDARSRSEQTGINGGNDSATKSVESSATRSSNETPFSALGLAWELDFTMMYIDYVFPLLFPFYRPPLVATSRAWLLPFVKQNRTTLHSVLSLSSFFFTYGLTDVFPEEHQSCRYTMWGQVVDQARMSYGMLQVDLAEMTASDHKPTLLEKARMMETIVHLMVSDLFVGRSSDWEAHIIPALSLFDDILTEHGTEAVSGFYAALDSMSWPRPYFPGFQLKLWNADQAAFRFFSAILIVADILASTSLRRKPRLGHLHAEILGDSSPERIAEGVDLFSFIGCQNWVLLAIGEIAALDEMKKQKHPDSAVDHPELIALKDRVFQMLQSGFERLDKECQDSLPRHEAASSRVYPWYQPGTHSLRRRSHVPTRIWTHSACIYLESVILTSELPSSTISDHVSRVMDLLEEIDDPSKIRALAWPICVAGCFAEKEEDQKRFRDVLASIGTVQMKSAAFEAGQIMEETWRQDRNSEGVVCETATYLGILGYPALLL